MRKSGSRPEQTALRMGYVFFSHIALRELGLLIKVCMCSPLQPTRSYADVSKNWQLKTEMVSV